MTYVAPEMPAPGQLFTYTVAIVQGTREGIHRVHEHGRAAPESDHLLDTISAAGVAF